VHDAPGESWTLQTMARAANMSRSAFASRFKDVVGQTPVEDLLSLAPAPSQVVTIANYTAGQAGARLSGGGADSQPTQALAEVAGLLEQNKVVIKVQTFPFERAVEAYRISLGGHLRGKLVLVP